MTLVVFPNLGAEEGEGWPQALAHPAAKTLAKAFISLFGPSAEVVGPVAVPSTSTSPPAFPWLEKPHGLYPWLATPEAEREAEKRRLPLLGPSAEAVTRVHDKAFVQRARAHADSAHSSTRNNDPAAAFHVVIDADLCRRPSQLRALVQSEIDRWPGWLDRGFILKPRFGTSGRGRCAGQVATALSDRAINRLSKRGGAILEPWLQKQQDFSVQLYVPKQGEPEVLATTLQQVRPSGGYLGNEGVIDEHGRASAGLPWEERLLPPALALVKAAQAEGFSGPCGVDAMQYLGPDGKPCLRSVVELNARCTGATVLAARVHAAVHAGTAKPGDGFSYSAVGDRLEIRPGPAIWLGEA